MSPPLFLLPPPSRSWRMGQTRSVVVKRFYVKGSVEERIMEVVTARQHSAGAGAGAGGGEAEEGGRRGRTNVRMQVQLAELGWLGWAGLGNCGSLEQERARFFVCDGGCSFGKRPGSCWAVLGRVWHLGRASFPTCRQSAEAERAHFLGGRLRSRAHALPAFEAWLIAGRGCAGCGGQHPGRPPAAQGVGAGDPV
jgi:hypothetical protein